jgi:hypothetical protein
VRRVVRTQTPSRSGHWQVSCRWREARTLSSALVSAIVVVSSSVGAAACGGNQHHYDCHSDTQALDNTKKITVPNHFGSINLQTQTQNRKDAAKSCKKAAVRKSRQAPDGHSCCLSSLLASVADTAEERARLRIQPRGRSDRRLSSGPADSRPQSGTTCV